MQHLDILSLARLSRTCKRFRDLYKDKSVWKSIDLSTLPKNNVRKMKKLIKDRLPPDLHTIKLTSNASSTVQKKSPPVITVDVLNELLTKCPNIKSLTLMNCDFRDIKNFKDCLLMKHISLSAICVSDCLTDTRWLSHVNWPKLTSLSLARSTKTSQVDVRIIAESWPSSLTVLNLTGCYQIKDEVVDALVPLRKLHTLDLSLTSVTDTVFTKAQCLVSLHRLYVNGVRSITDEGICSIPTLLPHLTELGISNLPKVNQLAISTLVEKLPNTKIQYQI